MFDVTHAQRVTGQSPARKLDILLQQSTQVKKQRPPKAYRYVEIKHTKLGIEEFDFR